MYDKQETMVAWNLSELANAAVNEATQENKVDTPVEDPNSNDNTANKTSIAIAHKFLSKTCPAFLESKAALDPDRLVKVGRSIADLVSIAGGHDIVAAGLSAVVDQCDMLSRGLKVPKVRFGKTELQMPIVTLRCMSFSRPGVVRLQS